MRTFVVIPIFSAFLATLDVRSVNKTLSTYCSPSQSWADKVFSLKKKMECHASPWKCMVADCKVSVYEDGESYMSRNRHCLDVYSVDLGCVCR